MVRTQHQDTSVLLRNIYVKNQQTDTVI